MKRFCFAIALMACILYACDTKEQGRDDPEQGLTCVTKGSSDLTEISARLTGYTELEGNVELGFIYSTDKAPVPENGTVVSPEGMVMNRQFTASVTGLLSNTTYYFRAFLRQNGKYTYGATKSFTTKEIKASVFTGEAKDITARSATLTSSCTFTDNVLPSSLLVSGVFFLYSDSINERDPLIAGGKRIEADAKTGAAALSDLKGETTYSYIAGYTVQGLSKPVYGNVRQFIPSDKPAETLHKCSETRIVDEMLFSSSCARTTSAVQQGFHYDPVGNTLYFFQLNRWYRNVIGWTRPEVTLSTAVAPNYMGLRCFSHGNNINIERTASGQIYVWAPNFGSRGDGSYGSPWIVSRMPLKETKTLSEDIKNTEPTDNYYFGVSPCWPAIDFEEDLIAVCTYKKVYVYRLSEVRALPQTKVRLPKQITYGGLMTSSSSTTTYDTGIPEFTGYPEVLARDVSQLTPLIVFDSTYSKRGLHWQTFCIGNGKAYFLNMGDVPDGSVIKHDTYIEVYDLKTGKLLREKVRQEYIQDKDWLAAKGFVEPDYCYAEPEGIQVIGDTMYVLYTCRGNTAITIRRPVIFKLSSDI